MARFTAGFALGASLATVALTYLLGSAAKDGLIVIPEKPKSSERRGGAY